MRYQNLITSAAAILLALCLTPADAAPAAVASCEGCHGADGVGDDPMVPIIAGMPAPHIEEALFLYMDGARKCPGAPEMCEATAELDDNQIAELADYYSAMEHRSAGEEFDESLAGKGKILHQELCSKCHLAPNDEGAADAIGNPLHGQRKAYLEYAVKQYLTGEREQIPSMASKMEQLNEDDLDALIDFYASYQ